jgi:hypothetical protein
LLAFAIASCQTKINQGDRPNNRFLYSTWPRSKKERLHWN